MSKKQIDIAGQRFGRLIVLKYDRMDKWKSGRWKHMWFCQCDCGNLKSISSEALRSGTASCGCLKNEYLHKDRPQRVGLGNFKNIVDLRFGRLIVVKRSPIKTKNHSGVMWECVCDCGRQVTVPSGSLLSGNTKSCGCLQIDNRLGNTSRQKPFGESMFLHVLGEYKRGAKKRGLVFELSNDEFKSITSKECYYCGHFPSTVRNFGWANGSFVFNGIDRKDNSIGYTIENCVPCCFVCNRAKGTLSVEEFVVWAKKLVANLEAQRA